MARDTKASKSVSKNIPKKSTPPRRTPKIVFRVNYCPHCGGHFNSLRDECIAIFENNHLTPPFRRNTCATCGIERSEVSINLKPPKTPAL